MDPTYRKKCPNRWPITEEEYPKGNKLGLWCAAQRALFRKKKLSPERIRFLEAIGFQWDPYQDTWAEKYLYLVAYRKKYPDCWPMSNEEYPKGNKLGAWVKWQRQCYRKKKLCSERIRFLEELGFKWDFQP